MKCLKDFSSSIIRQLCPKDSAIPTAVEKRDEADLALVGNVIDAIGCRQQTAAGAKSSKDSAFLKHLRVGRCAGGNVRVFWALRVRLGIASTPNA